MLFVDGGEPRASPKPALATTTRACPPCREPSRRAVEIAEVRAVASDAGRLRADLPDRRIERGLATASYEDRCTFRDEAPGDGKADARRAAGDDRRPCRRACRSLAPSSRANSTSMRTSSTCERARVLAKMLRRWARAVLCAMPRSRAASASVRPWTSRCAIRASLGENPRLRNVSSLGAARRSGSAISTSATGSSPTREALDGRTRHDPHDERGASARSRYRHAPPALRWSRRTRRAARGR